MSRADGACHRPPDTRNGPTPRRVVVFPIAGRGGVAGGSGGAFISSSLEWASSRVKSRSVFAEPTGCSGRGTTSLTRGDVAGQRDIKPHLREERTGHRHCGKAGNWPPSTLGNQLTGSM